MLGQVLVHLLALSTDTLPAAWRRHKLQGDWFTRACEAACALISIFSLHFQYTDPADAKWHVVEPGAAVACCNYTKQLAALTSSFLSKEPARNVTNFTLQLFLLTTAVLKILIGVHLVYVKYRILIFYYAFFPSLFYCAIFAFVKQKCIGRGSIFFLMICFTLQLLLFFESH